MQKISAGFWSYVHADDEYERGRISRLRDRLQSSVRFHTGISFDVFLDKKDIAWGQQWEERIKNSLNDAVLLFPIITPSYFRSKACREEFLAFRQRQEKLGRDDLILPIYYLMAEILEGSYENFDADQIELAQYFSSHQYEDFRSLRVAEETDPSYAQSIERLGQRAAEALKRSRADITSPPSTTLPKVLTSEADEVTEPAAGATLNRDNEAPGHITSLTVNQMPGRADFTSIVDAVARAPGGARIVVHPGRYRECVIIDKPLELVGTGNMEDIVIESNEGEPLTFDTNIGLVQNFTIRQTTPYDSAVKTRDDGVWIKQGRLELENCDISSTNGASVCVSNEADPRVRRNRIHNAKQSGIAIMGRARGTYEDNEVFGNSFSGISVSKEAAPTVRRNRSYGNSQSGLFIHSGAEGLYEDNEILDNQFSGVTVREANPILRRNRIYANRQSGTLIGGNASGTFEDNEIFRNAAAGVKVEEGARPAFRRNKINENGYEAIWITKGGGGHFSDNDLKANALGSLDVTEASSDLFTIERNIEDDS